MQTGTKHLTQHIESIPRKGCDVSKLTAMPTFALFLKGKDQNTKSSDILTRKDSLETLAKESRTPDVNPTRYNKVKNKDSE